MQLGGCADGLPVTFVMRKILQMPSYDDAVDFLYRIKVAAGHNYTLSTRGRVGSFECSPKQVVEYKPHPQGQRVCQANHPMINDDTTAFDDLLKKDPDNNWGSYANSRIRFTSMAARVMNKEGAVSLDDIKRALRAKDDPENPVCRDTSTDTGASFIAYTSGSMIYQFDDTATLHLASGPPSEVEFLTFTFS